MKKYRGILAATEAQGRRLNSSTKKKGRSRQQKRKRFVQGFKPPSRFKSGFDIY
ncbi:hypothetical protein HanRHA438_Chr05g0236291 [Helianthus annuus]|nr:hypothetical protein HanRHA438_Chr05g0236291 [Helianthus annuus]